MLGKTVVLRRVWHDKWAVFQDRVRTKRHLPGNLTDQHPLGGLEPEPGFIHEGNQCDGRVEEFGRQLSDLLELRLRWSVEQCVTGKRLQPGGFVGWRRVQHGRSFR